MIGTCREIMYIISLKLKWNKDLPLTTMQKKNLTMMIRRGSYGEAFCAKWLPYFGAVKLRDPYFHPALYINDSGFIIDEESLKEIVTSHRNWYAGSFSPRKACDMKYKSCRDIAQVDMDKIAKGYGYKPYKPRLTFPSIWEVKQTLDARYFPRVDLNVYVE